MYSHELCIIHLLHSSKNGGQLSGNKHRHAKVPLQTCCWHAGTPLRGVHPGRITSSELIFSCTATVALGRQLLSNLNVCVSVHSNQRA